MMKVGDKVKHKQYGWDGVVYHVSRGFIAVDIGNDRIRPGELETDWAYPLDAAEARAAK